MSNHDLSKAMLVKDIRDLDTLRIGDELLIRVTVSKMTDSYVHLSLNGGQEVFKYSDLVNRVYRLPRAFAPGDVVEWDSDNYTSRNWLIIFVNDDIAWIEGIEDRSECELVDLPYLTLIRAADEKEG